MSNINEETQIEIDALDDDALIGKLNFSLIDSSYTRWVATRYKTEKQKLSFRHPFSVRVG